MLFGDSIVAGYGLGGAEVVSVRLESMLAQKGYQVSIFNAGVSGDTSAAGRARLAFALKKHHPDAVLLALGANDMLRGLPPSLTRENLAAMLETLRAAKVRVIFSAVQASPTLGAPYVAEFNRIYPELAAQYKVPLYPFLLEKTYGHNDLMQADSLHPNALGAERIAQDLAAYFEANLLKK